MKKKFDIKIFIIIILTILVFTYLIFFNIKKNTKVEITAEISLVGTNYVIATDQDNNDYLINTSNEYNIGDIIKVTMKNLKKGNPYTGEIIKIDTISKNISFEEPEEEIINNDNNTNQNDNDTNNNINQNQENLNIIPNQNNNIEESNTNTNDNTSNITTEEISAIKTDEEVVTYLTNFSNEIDTTNIKETIKEKFISVVDFLFYDEPIGEVTFDELSTTTKLKVLELALTIDQKIENKFPGYKETISTNSNRIYTNLKTRALEIYLDITTSVCKDNQELCNDAKIGLGELKRSFSITWDFIKDISGIGLEKLKNWYEVWRDSE